MHLTMPSGELILLIAPVVVLELGLMAWALYDLSRPTRRVRGDSKLSWALVILFFSVLGPIAYLALGRDERPPEEAEERRPWQVDPQTGELIPRDRASQAAGPGAAGALGAADRTGIGRVDATERRPERDRMPHVAVPAATGVGVSGVGGTEVPATDVGAGGFGPGSVSCRGLTKRYPGVLALDRLDLDVPAGSVFGLLGPNGAGKTTTLRLLVGLTHPSSGSAAVAGVQIGAAEVAHRIGFLDQDPRYYGWSTGREIVRLAGRLHGLDGARLRARVAEVLERVGLADAADRRVATYSGGMRQRLGIAQALVNRPSVLILDEPVSSLDPEGRRDLLILIAELRASSTILFSTHVLADVERICDRVAIIDHGHLLTEGPLDELLDRYALPIYQIEPEAGQAAAIDRLVGALGSADWVTDVSVVHGIVRVTVSDFVRASHELLPAIVAAGLAVAAVERVRPSLEDVFLRVVAQGTPGGRA